jgi:hypothetical protein
MVTPHFAGKTKIKDMQSNTPDIHSPHRHAEPSIVRCATGRGSGGPRQLNVTESDADPGSLLANSANSLLLRTCS